MKSLQLLLPKNKKINCQKIKQIVYVLVTKSCNTIVSTLNSFCMWDKPLSVLHAKSTEYLLLTAWFYNYWLYKWVDF